MAREVDLLNVEYRKKVIEQIMGEENKRRKAEPFKRVEIYNRRQSPWIIKALESEYSPKTVRDMRKITSINLTQRITDEMASIYKNAPERRFGNVNDKQTEHLENLYDHAKANVKLKKGNKRYKLLDQAALQVVPKNGRLEFRIYGGHQCDVIPREDDPEKAMAYIISVLNKDNYLSENVSSSKTKYITDKLRGPSNKSDGVNQSIADDDDYKPELMRYVWWSDHFNFTTDGHGEIIDGETDQPRGFNESLDSNPIEKLPFVDIAGEKDFEFWVRRGNGIVDFNVDFGVLLSDTATINRNQGYSQAVMYSAEKPESLVVGPQRVLWLKQMIGEDGEAVPDPKFEFATPSPDMAAALELLETYIRFFLTTQGIDPKTVSGKSETQRFSSGWERLLAMIEKFEASKDDIDLFHDVEAEVFDLVVRWNNALQGTDFFIDKLIGPEIPEDAYVEVQFQRPEMIQTQVEKEDSNIKLMDKGLKDEVEVIMDLEGVDEDQATEMWLAREVRRRRLQVLLKEVLKKEGLEDALPTPPVAEPKEDDESESDDEDSEDDDDESENGEVDGQGQAG